MPVPSMVALQACKTPATVGGFDPETDITWHSLFWAEGSAFTALGLADGASVTTWPNETVETDATEATNAPSYVASAAGLNGRPAVDFDGVNDRLIASSWSSEPTLPTSVVMVFELDSVAGNPRLFVANSNVGVGVSIVSSTPSWQIANTTGRTGGTPATGAQFLSARFSDVDNEYMNINGANVIDQNSGGAGITGGVRIAHRNNDLFMDGRIALFGVYEGDILADGAYTDFKTWVSSHYGITIA